MSGWKKGLLLVGDIAILYVALAGALLVRYGTSGFADTFPDHRIAFVPVFLLTLLIFYLLDLYHLRTFLTSLILFRTTTLAAITAGIVSMGAFYLFPNYFELTPKTNLALFVAFVLALSYGWRAFLRLRFKASAVPVVFVGTSPRIIELIDEVTRSPHLGYRVAHHYETLDAKNGSALENLADTKGLALLVMDPKLAHDAGVARTLYRIIPREVNVIPFATFYEAIFEKVPLEDLSEEWFIENISTRRPVYDRVKRIVDVALSAVLFVALLPLALLITLLITLTSRGGALYRAERTGKAGLPFVLNKFRTMKKGENGPLWTEKNDTRVTAVGKIIRATHLDEIPQLWNIIRGDISFTGPRPENVGLVREYEKFPHYEMRHVVKPGITGWAQINYKPSASLEEAYEKLKYDLYYVKNRSLFLDLLIVLKTIRYVFVNHR